MCDTVRNAGEKNPVFDVQAFWNAVLRQDPTAMRPFFHPDAQVNWHNTNECFTAKEFIRANCVYPGRWTGKIERVTAVDGGVITAAHVCGPDGTPSFHVVSFFRVADGKIAALDEYWGDDGDAPQWRQALRIGRKIK